MGKKNESASQETRFTPCVLCGAVTIEYEIEVRQISTSKLIAVLHCCTDCANKTAN